MNNTPSDPTSFDRALQKAQTWMDEVDGVVGVAEGQFEGERCITVWVTIKEAAQSLPPVVDGIRVIVEMSEPFQALPF